MPRITCPATSDIVAVMRRKSLRLFENPSGHDLNLVGIRNSTSRVNQFDDWITISYWYDGAWTMFAFPGTTDPGTYYRENPINVSGTAILKPGQYRGAFKVGRHKGYKALRQAAPVTVYRDNDRDTALDTADVIEDTGLFGINMHRASRIRASTQVDKWSAGCQVLQDPDHFDFLMTLCQRGADKFGNSFTYTLLESKEFNG